MMQPVLKVTQSPLNKHRWCLDLKCGHEVWITSKTRPKRQKADCYHCDNQEVDR